MWQVGVDNEPIPARCPHRLPPEADGDRVLVDANVKSSSSPPRILLPLVEGCAADGDLPFLRSSTSQSRSPLLKLSFRRAGNENSRSLSRPAAFPSFAEEGGATQISCFISLRKRISFVDVPDDIFSAILTALNIVICFPFQNAFSDTVRFFERKTHRG